MIIEIGGHKGTKVVGFFFYLPDLFLKEEEFDDTIGVIRIRKLKDRQHNDKKKKNKRANNDLQNGILKTNHRETQLKDIFIYRILFI